MTPNRKNLSDSRGNALGIGIFLFFLHMLGVNRTCELVWLISFFYALFDRKARRAASHYLKRRFPGAGRIAMFRHTWALFTNQGQALIETRAMGAGRLAWRFENGGMIRKLIEGEQGFILLSSHFSCWQALIGGLGEFRRPVNLLVTPDANLNVDKFVAAGELHVPVRVISTLEAMGGLVDAADALERGEVVCMMGDRCFEGEGAHVEFLGEEAVFPYAAFYLAARCSCPVLPLFAVRERAHTSFIVHYGNATFPKLSGRRRSDLTPYVREYVSELENMANLHPYRCFLFENIWSSGK